MKFVHIEDFFHPSAGYQLNMLSRLQAKQGHEIIIVTSEIDKVPDNLTAFFGKENIEERDREFEKANNVEIIRLPIVTFYSGRAIFKSNLIKYLKQLCPDVLFIHGNDTLTSIRILMNYKNLGVPMVMDNHMLEMATVNKFSKYFRAFYRKFITPIIIEHKIPTIKIVESDFVEKNYAIPLSLIRQSSFGTDADYFAPNSKMKNTVRKKLRIADEDFVILYAGKMDKVKGGIFLSQSLKERFVSQKNRNVVFIIIGNSTNDTYGDEVETNFKESENRIIRISTQTYTDLAKYYQMADIAVFPKQCSMSYFEVQACELPVILEKNEINIERASDSKGLLFSKDSKNEFREAVVEFINMDHATFSMYKANSRKNIVHNYNYVPVAQFFTDLMIETYNNFYKNEV